MKVKEAIMLLEKMNPDLSIFICLNTDEQKYIEGKMVAVTCVDKLIECSQYIAVLPSTSLEIQCPT